jgi:hypothetical protein
MRLPILGVSGLLTLAACGCSSNKPAATATAAPTTKPAVLSSGDVCTLSPEELATRRQQLIPGLFKRAEQVSDIPGGLRFRFASHPGLVADLSRVMEQEQDCCSFLRFELTMEPNGGPVSFDVTGPAGTGDMLRKL